MRKSPTALFAAICLCVAGLLTTGCETDTAARPITITPSDAIVRHGQRLTLTASGDFYFTWTIENQELGLLSPRTGRSVEYLSLYEGTNWAYQTITVEGIIIGSSGSDSSNAAPYQVTAESLIRQIK